MKKLANWTCLLALLTLNAWAQDQDKYQKQLQAELEIAAQKHHQATARLLGTKGMAGFLYLKGAALLWLEEIVKVDKKRPLEVIDAIITVLQERDDRISVGFDPHLNNLKELKENYSSKKLQVLLEKLKFSFKVDRGLLVLFNGFSVNPYLSLKTNLKGQF